MSPKILITEREKIRTEWQKTELDVLKDIKIIKDWLETQKHLPEIPTDNMIEFFLTNCKYSIEKTKQNLDMYYTVRSRLPEFYRDIHPVTSPNMAAIYETADYATLPKLTPSLHRIHIAKYRDADADKTDIRKLMGHIVNNVYEVRIHEDLALGEIYIVDMEYITFGVANKFTPPFLKQFATILEKVHSNRMKALHLLNMPTFMDVILNIFKNFLSKKLQNRIFIHHSLEELYQHIPKEMLPVDYGGNEKSIKEIVDSWKEKFIEYKERFDKLENMCVDESLRSEKLENDDALGYHGTFKEINID